MDLSGHTQPFAVLGHPIGHTLSPVMHNCAFTDLGMDAIYLAFDVAPERLMQTLPAMADMGFRGVNLTVPLKEVAFRGLDDLDPSAADVGAVNTVEFTAHGMRGHNTDGEGFLRALDEAFGSRVEAQAVMVLGCGGAGRALALTCARHGAARITLADIDAGRCAQVRDEIARLETGVVLDVLGTRPEDWSVGVASADLVIQATPVGMKPDDAPLLGVDAFRAGQCVFDLIYMYPETATLREASKAGAATANGLGMLLHQGVRAFEIWTGVTPPVDAMRDALEARVYA